MWPNPQFPAHLVKFTEEILNGENFIFCADGKTLVTLSMIPYSNRIPLKSDITRFKTGASDLILSAFNITSQVNELSSAVRLSFASVQWMAPIPSARVIITATDKMLKKVVLEKSPSPFYFKTARFLYMQNSSLYCGNINQIISETWSGSTYIHAQKTILLPARRLHHYHQLHDHYLLHLECSPQILPISFFFPIYSFFCHVIFSLLLNLKNSNLMMIIISIKTKFVVHF